MYFSMLLLPPDIERMILMEYLTDQEHCPPRNVSLVCKSWHRALTTGDRACVPVTIGRNLILCARHANDLLQVYLTIIGHWLFADSSIVFVHTTPTCDLATLFAICRRLVTLAELPLVIRYVCCEGQGLCLELLPSISS